ncbi:MAG: hypothetical protein PHN71_01040 [Candidatus Cloacimonetes bacterium]|nr:periplasmic heavy metal sensor [Candidatus Cloacimonadota bacterium]MDY0298372.1 hypothetical protein [Candidatus Cloacimonadaceae bacterium]MCB5278017.1 periplasmic heavy metal sensor [Candidatus Cloacimonadota bacterium]MCK9332819.1 periplasmic heavy metal sensor [Candidatus Cloacimonadota bacterium]MDD2209888.1 hypothetical protein [Candidatus Cloacimonadota bacterium]
MSKRLITMLLIVSLAFNLAVLSSIIWLHYRLPHPPHHTGSYERPRLPEHIKSMPMDKELGDMRREYDEYRIRFMRKLALEDYSEQNLIAIIDSSLAAQHKLEEALGTRLINLRKQMSAEEAFEYFNARADIMEQRMLKIENYKYRRTNYEKNTGDKPDYRDERRRPDGPKSR